MPPTAFIRLIRPVNSLITGLTVIVGGILAAKGTPPDSTLILCALSAALVAAGGNVINDVYDVDIDHINRPDRPLPANQMTLQAAVVFGIVLILSGVLTGVYCSPNLGLIALSVSILLWVYSWKFKRLPLIGNAAVAVCGGLAFIYGALAMNNLMNGVIPAIFAFLIHLAREIVKDAEDEAGDRSSNAKTLPIVIGNHAAQKIAALTLIILGFCTIIPYVYEIYGIQYLSMVLLAVDLPLTYLIIVLFRGLSKPRLSLASRMLKGVMVMGLVALYLG